MALVSVCSVLLLQPSAPRLLRDISNCSENTAALKMKDACIRTFQQVKQEYAILRRKLEVYFQMVRKATGDQKA